MAKVTKKIFLALCIFPPLAFADPPASVMKITREAEVKLLAIRYWTPRARYSASDRSKSAASRATRICL